MLKELFVTLLLPPANLPLFAMIGLIIRRWCRRLGEWMTAISVVLLLLLSMPIIGGTMLVALEQGLPPHKRPATRPAAIVILSADITR